jgi:hypothetical protein
LSQGFCSAPRLRRRRDGWRNKSGEPTANEDLWGKILKSLDKLSKLGVRVDFVYQKGKKTKIGNGWSGASWLCPSLQPRPGMDFDPDAAERGDALFSGKANCNSCHREPLWTEPGWNQHSAVELKIDSAPASINATGEATHGYRTMNLAGIFVRENGLFMNPQNKGHLYHDGRFLTLLDTVKSYNPGLVLD